MNEDRSGWLPSDYVRHGWCKGVFARDASDNQVPSTDALRACKWCAEGAVYVFCFRTKNNSVEIKLLDQLQSDVGAHVPKWNDAPERTQAEVVAALEAAEIKLGLRSPTGDST